MGKLLLAIVFSFLMFAPTYATVGADPVDIIPPSACSGAEGSPACAKNTDDPITGTGGIIIKVANILAWFGGAIAVIMIVFAGFTYVTSAGEASKVKRAKDIILYAAVGLIVIVVARMIVIFVINKVG